MQKIKLPSVNKVFLNSTKQIEFKRPLQITSILNKQDIPSNLNIFDRNTKRIQRNSIVSDTNFKDYEYIKSEVGYRVADRIFDIKRSFNTVVDLGCQRGYVSKHLEKVRTNIFT
jgi:hypothetical protein